MQSLPAHNLDMPCPQPLGHLNARLPPRGTVQAACCVSGWWLTPSWYPNRRRPCLCFCRHCKCGTAITHRPGAIGGNAAVAPSITDARLTSGTGCSFSLILLVGSFGSCNDPRRRRHRRRRQRRPSCSAEATRQQHSSHEKRCWATRSRLSPSEPWCIAAHLLIGGVRRAGGQTSRM